MFWRIVIGRVSVSLGICVTLIGVAGVPQDVATWLGWLEKVPPSVLLVAGSLLLMGYVFANRKRVAASTSRLFAATHAGYTAFRRAYHGPGIRAAVWSDLDCGLPADEMNQETNQWEIMEHTVRRTGLVGGEAYPALVGMAQVKELHGQRRLYMCLFVHAAGSHMELRIESHHDPIVRRHAVLRVEGEVLSDMTFAPCLTAAVSDTRRWEGVREEAAHLLNVGTVLSLSVTDTIRVAGDLHEHRHDILRVPLTGYRAANDRLSGIADSVWMASVHSYSPPEIAPSLDPRLLDRTMKSLAEPSAYREWRNRAAEQFGTEGDASNAAD